MLAAGTSDYKNQSRKLRPELAAEVGEADANALLSGRPGSARLASLGPLIGLSRLAAGEISAADYIRDFGHRGPSEFELSIPAPCEQEGWLEAQAASTSENDQSVQDLLEQKTRGFEAAWKRLQVSHPKKAAAWDRRLEALHQASHTREAVRSEVVRRLRLLRPFALRAAALAGIGEEVFFLTLEEIARLLEGDRSVLAAVPDRSATHERLVDLPPYPPFIRGKFDPAAWARDPDRAMFMYNPTRPAGERMDDTGDDEIRGFSGSPGVVSGRVRVLASIEEAALFSGGEILVAHTTNVGWTPLFPRAAANVTDVGAPLSHAAIVARELGIPAVVGTGTATAKLKTGMEVRVDGARGTVTIL
jgi:pyruvate,water dikinase